MKSGLIGSQPGVRFVDFDFWVGGCLHIFFFSEKKSFRFYFLKKKKIYRISLVSFSYISHPNIFPYISHTNIFLIKRRWGSDLETLMLSSTPRCSNCRSLFLSFFFRCISCFQVVSELVSQYSLRCSNCRFFFLSFFINVELPAAHCTTHL